MNTLDEIAEKIQKLQAMVDGSSNQNEVEIATAKINSLLLDYNLSMEQVQGFSVDKDKVINEIWQVDDGHNLDSWRGKLANTLSKYNFCRCIHISGSARLHLFGKPKNVEIVKWLYNFVTSRLEDICINESIVAKAYHPEISLRTWRNSFYLGAGSAIYRKLAAQHGELENTTSGRELVVVRTAETDAAVKEVYRKGLTKHNNHSRLISDAYHKGIETGNNLTLGKPIDHKKLPQLTDGS